MKKYGSVKLIWVIMTKNVVDPFYLRNSYWMLPADLGQIVYVFVSDYLDMSTLDYLNMSAQMQWKSLCGHVETAGSAVGSVDLQRFRSWFRGFVLQYVKWVSFFMYGVCWIGNELVANWSIRTKCICV